MNKEIPYYAFDETDTSKIIDGEAYIDDGDLKEMLLDYLGDKISEEDIQKILDAASDEDLTEEEFDKLVEDFILKNKD